MKKLYLVDTTFGRLSITVADIVQDSPKTYKITNERILFGRHMTYLTRVNKDKAKHFDNLNSAILCAYDILEKRKEWHISEAARAEEDMELVLKTGETND